MIRIDYKDLIKTMKLLEKEGTGGALSIKTDGVVLKISCMDRTGQEMTIEINDVDYPMMPRVTKVETF